jgi:hypothetical protein
MAIFLDSGTRRLRLTPRLRPFVLALGLLISPDSSAAVVWFEPDGGTESVKGEALHGLANVFQFESEVPQHLSSHARLLAEQTKQEVFGTDTASSSEYSSTLADRGVNGSVSMATMSGPT